jgi:hypothetical protein
MKRQIFTMIAFLCLSSSALIAQPFPDRHSTSMTDNWLSCTSSQNPNTNRGISHWLRIDLGDTYALQTSKIWNFTTPERINSYENAGWSLSPLPGKLTDGIKDMVIDLSMDGITWVEWGRYSLAQATGSGFYEGSVGPDFQGKIARYILITGVTNHGGTCYGLGEVKINGTIATVSNTNDVLASATMMAQPNPFGQSTTISVDGFPNGRALFIMRDLLGKEVASYQVDILDGKGVVNVQGASLQAGMYMLTATVSGGTKTLKLEVIK